MGEKAEFRDTLGYHPVAHFTFYHTQPKYHTVEQNGGQYVIFQAHENLHKELLKTGPWEGQCRALHKYTISWGSSKTYMNFSRQLDPTLKAWPQKENLFSITSQTLKRKQVHPNTHNCGEICPFLHLLLEQLPNLKATVNGENLILFWIQSYKFSRDLKQK